MQLMDINILADISRQVLYCYMFDHVIYVS